MPATIQFKDVSKFYSNNIAAVQGITFEIEQGELVFLSGQSGAGKSTLLKMIAAIEFPDSGTLIVNGQNIGELRSRSIPFLRQNMGLIMQQPYLLNDRNILFNVMLPLLVTGVAKSDARIRAKAALSRVNMLDRKYSFPLGLSGGEQQRVAVARAIVNRPKIILADEPTTHLDKDSANHIIDTIAFFQLAGVTCLFATHDDQLVARANRAIYLEYGKLVRIDQNSSSARQT